MAIKNVDIDFELMNVISAPPKKQHEMYAQACSNDGITISTWRDIWLKNIQDNHKKYGPFKDRGLGKLHGIFEKKPCIVAGSGPSLRGNVEQLRDTKGIPVISCLHNYHFMVDNDVKVDYFVTLDAGEITLKEVSEGGKKKHEDYIKSTKDKTLVAFIGTSPRLLDSWKGEILFYNCPIPSIELVEEIRKVEEFHTYVSSGGNVLGASTYISKAIFGANPTCFVGADFCFSYTKKFHPWDSSYDKDLGVAMRGVDIYGHKVLTWQSYFNFKVWFDWLACTVPGLYINCSEGGMMGAYPEGNIMQIHQMELSRLVRMYSMHEDIKDQCLKPEIPQNKILF